MVIGIGGGVWESNPPKHALAYSQTVLKTAPITGQDAPPRELISLTERSFVPKSDNDVRVKTSVTAKALLREFPALRYR
jgi:hypothetical protein